MASRVSRSRRRSAWASASAAEAVDRPVHDLARLLLQVEAGLDGEITLGSLAREAGYSPFHFHRLFSRQLGETPAGYVHRIRLERAAYLVAVKRGYPAGSFPSR